MSYVYKPYNYLKDTFYKDVFFRFDPTVPVPVPEGHEDFGKTLAEIHNIPDEDAKSIVLTEKWNQVRNYRDTLLKETDWVAGEDVPQSIKDQYFPYRQALREVTDQGNPDSIVWPIKP